MLLIALPCLAQEKEEQAAPAAEQDKPKPLGDQHNPVKCDGPRGERYYLSRLVDPDGREIDFSRMGSFGGPNGGILDGYNVTIGEDRIEVFMDMYHQGYYEETPIPGFYLRCRMSWDLLIHEDGLRYADGADQPFDGVYTKLEEETGKTAAKVPVVKGRLHGKAAKWHDNGKYSQLISFKDGLMHGEAHYYDEEEKQVASFDYQEGLRHGEATWFRADGSIEAQYIYAKGRPYGPHYTTHANGSIKRKGQFKDGRTHGEFIHYDEAGNETKRELYRNGELVENNEAE